MADAREIISRKDIPQLQKMLTWEVEAELNQDMIKYGGCTRNNFPQAHPAAPKNLTWEGEA